MKLTRIVLLLMVVECVAVTAYAYPASHQMSSPSPSPSPTPTQRSESLWSWFLRVTGVSATPRNMREDHRVKPGRIWIYNRENKVRKRILTDDGGYSSPVFFTDDQNIYALQGHNLVKISIENGTKQVVGEVKGAFKLIGFAPDDSDKLVLVKDEDQDTCPSVAVFSLSTKTVTPVSYKKEGDDQSLISHYEQDTRLYDQGAFELITQKVGSDSFNVFLQEKDKEPVNVSNCDGVHCSQGAISTDRKRVAFIKEE